MKPAFNVVKTHALCPSCGDLAARRIQFRYGVLGEYEYLLGDELRWGVGAIGDTTARLVMARGRAEACEKCGSGGDEFEIHILDNTVASVKIASGKYSFLGYNDHYFVIVYA